MSTRLNTWALLLLMLLVAVGFAIAQKPLTIKKAIMTVTPSRVIAVQIHCTSGVPNPVMMLEQSELNQYRRLLGQFVTMREGEEEAWQMFSWYGGMTISESGSGDKPVHFLLYGRRILSEPQMDEYDGPLYSADRIAPDSTLERYLLSLARDKGLIPENIYQMILKDVQEKSERGRIQRKYEVRFFANMGHMMLEPSEAQEYRRLRSQFKEPTKPDKFAMDINKNTGGVGILEMDDRGISAPYPNSQRFFGRRSIALIQKDEHGVDWWNTGKVAPDNALQLYILDLGLKKGVISDDIYQQISRAVEEMPSYPQYR
jgi:hypothetical protein